MKKLLLISIALFIAAGSLSVAAQNNIKLSGQVQTHNTSPDYPDFEISGLPIQKIAKTGQDWWEPDTVKAYITKNGTANLESHKIIYKYNPQGLLLEKRNDETAYFTGNDPWGYYTSITTYTYDSSNNLLTELEKTTGIRENIEITSWESINQVTYTYDSSNNLLTSLNQNWLNNSWINDYQTANTYDSNSNLLTELYQNWEGDSWINDYQIIHIYDSNNNMLTKLRQNWEGDSWVDNYQHNCTYDTRNNLLTWTIQYPENNSWINNFQYAYTYDSNNNLLARIHQSWEGDSWMTRYQKACTYDSNNNMLTELHQRGRGENIWEDEIKFLMAYDENGNGTSMEFWLWDPFEEIWIQVNDKYLMKMYYNNMQSFFELQSVDIITASYKKVSGSGVGIESVPSPKLNVTVYPNPATTEIYVKLNSQQVTNYSIYNISGQQVKQGRIQGEANINIQSLLKGIYYIKLDGKENRAISFIKN